MLSLALVKLSGILVLALSLVSARAADLPPLNVAPSGQSLPGKVIWADLYTTDPTAAIAFYTGLFGWTETGIQRGHNVYTVFFNRGRPVAGIISRPAAPKDTGKGHWINYVAVADVNQTLNTAVANGGRIVHPAQNIPVRGMQAILADSQGSLIGVMQSSSGDPDDAEPVAGDWAWAHLFARDSVAASQFYHTVLGYDAVADNRDSQANVFLLNSQGMSRAALGPIPAREDAQPDWLSFIRVANLDDAIARATTLGGKVLVAPKATRPESRLAIIADSNDVAIGLVELATPTALEKQTP